MNWTQISSPKTLLFASFINEQQRYHILGNKTNAVNFVNTKIHYVNSINDSSRKWHLRVINL